MTDLFAATPLAPADPILGITEQFNADPSPAKVNLGVGVYQDASGKVPVLECVRTAEQRMAADIKPRGYLPIDGLPAYTALTKALVLGGNEELMGRAVTVEALGGTGALRIGAEFLKYADGVPRRVLISDPSWENHKTLFERTGFEAAQYRYYTPDGPDVDGMLDDLRAAAPGTTVVLHACCHNPTGEDLAPDQWPRVVDVVAERGLIPLLDMAYQGFSQGIAQDRAVIDAFAARGMPVLVANSFSKTFSLYGERVGSLTVIAANDDEAKRILSQLKLCVRTLYSNPPTHGAQVVATVLGDAELRAVWETELTGMRLRIKEMRAALASGLAAAGVAGDVSFVERQVGMFSYTGLSAGQMRELRDRHHVYGTDAGRICVGALNAGNLGQVCAALAAVA